MNSGFAEIVVKMVSFICNACGQTVRKTQVEKHYQNDCRSCDVLSCIDCGKDFHGDEYVGHTSCITEAEKYQGKLYKPKDKPNKGEHKQQEWLKVIISNLNIEFYPRTVNCVICSRIDLRDLHVGRLSYRECIICSLSQFMFMFDMYSALSTCRASFRPLPHKVECSHTTLVSQVFPWKY